NLVSSRPTYQSDVDQGRLIETESLAGTRDAPVLREAHPGMRQEEPGLDLPDGLADKSGVVLPLLLGDRDLQVLDLGILLADEDYHRDFRDAGDPGIGSQLLVERVESGGLLRVASACRLPLQQALSAV